MNDYLRQAQSIPAGRADMAVDAGLRAFMLGVFNKMAIGLALSGALAYAVISYEPLFNVVFGTPLRYVVMFGPIAILLISGFAMRNPSPTAAGAIYWSVVSLIGVSLGGILMSYTRSSEGMMDVAKAFFTTAGAFGALSLWGYTTKKDLTGFGSFLIMGLFGLIIASLINMFTHSAALSFAISIIGVGIFAGLTAYDTQRLKFQYYQLQGDARSLAVATSYGALSLYLDFINLFLMLLRLFGGSRN
ncbi:MAG TPA: Bax inhibitor-1/YccA family protein [Caulobacterales bacterium]|nr:Bax inhibitor-1/YccA family protein [Caulobacterales bacterium]